MQSLANTYYLEPGYIYFTKQAATIAKMASVKKLVIGHYSARYKELDDLLKEAKDVFQETTLAKDGLLLEL